MNASEHGDAAGCKEARSSGITAFRLRFVGAKPADRIIAPLVFSRGIGQANLVAADANAGKAAGRILTENEQIVVRIGEIIRRFVALGQRIAHDPVGRRVGQFADPEVGRANAGALVFAAGECNLRFPVLAVGIRRMIEPHFRHRAGGVVATVRLIVVGGDEVVVRDHRDLLPVGAADARRILEPPVAGPIVARADEGLVAADIERIVQATLVTGNREVARARPAARNTRPASTTTRIRLKSIRPAISHLLRSQS